MSVALGIIEGRFGRAWSWTDRMHVLDILAPVGYSFYHYGPKADRYLRREWRRPYPVEDAVALAAFSRKCRGKGLRFGMALTPVGATHPFDDQSKEHLQRKIAELDAIGIDDLVILFDDLPADLPRLAEEQADLVDFCAGRTRATQIYFCPSFYSDDPVLDRAFGQRPVNYLVDLGRGLDRSVRIYWTGEEVCSREINMEHLRRVTGELQRPVCIWDNYPVNDGVRMSRFLHLRSFTGRPAGNARYLSGHAINPAIQPLLSCIPAITLAMNYARNGRYSYMKAFDEAADTVLGVQLAALVKEDLPLLQDVGLERLGERRDVLRKRYAAIDHPAAREIWAWLEGRDLMTIEEVKTQ